MALSTSTSTLAVGASRTFNLSPGSALTLTTLPNCRVTVTETPNTVSASGVGGNASRTHNLQLGQTVTYGPYPMGGTVVVANASNSGGAVTWVRSDALVAESASGVVSLVSGDGTQWLIPGAATFTASDAGTDWYRVPDVLQVAATLDSGTSTTVLVEVRTAAGVVSTALTITADTVAQTLRNSILTREMHEFRIRRSSGTGTVTVIV